MNDDQLLLLKKQNDAEATKTLFLRYANYSKKLANVIFSQSYAPGLTADDFYSLGLTAFVTACQKYQIGSNTFKAYWEKIALHEMKKLLSENNRHYPPGNISLDACVKNYDDLTYAEVIGENDDGILSSYDLSNMQFEIKENPHSVLNEEEREVVLLRLKDYSYKEIAIHLKSNVKHIRYIYSKAKDKLSKIKRY